MAAAQQVTVAALGVSTVTTLRRRRLPHWGAESYHTGAQSIATLRRSG